jgi:hypothetical protein
MLLMWLNSLAFCLLESSFFSSFSSLISKAFLWFVLEGTSQRCWNCMSSWSWDEGPWAE